MTYFSATKLKTGLKNNWPMLAGFLAIVLLTAISYSNIAGHQLLNWDDKAYIIDNPRVQSINLDNVLWMLSDYELGNWHPLTWMSYAIDYQLWGTKALGYKISGIVLHIINSILVYFLCLKILTLARTNFHQGGSSWFARTTDSDLSIASMAVAVLFSIHTTHVESVTWIAERKDLLCGLFYLATLLAYLKFRETGVTNWRVIAIVLFLFALMAKSMAVTLPAVLVLLECYPLKALSPGASVYSNIRIVLKDKLSFILLSLLVSIITVLTQFGGIQGTEYLSYHSRIVNACMSIILYIYHFLLPLGLSPFYPFHPWSTDPNIYSFVPVVSVTGIAVFLILLARRGIFAPLIALLFFLVTLLPVIGLVKVGYQAAADRYIYLPSISFFILLAVLIAISIRYCSEKKLPKPALATVFIAVTAGLSWNTYQYNDVWKSDKKLWEYTIAQYPGLAGLAYSNLGVYYTTQAQFKKAVLLFNQSLEIDQREPLVMRKIGRAYEMMKRYDLARVQYREIIREFPDLHIGYVSLGDLHYKNRNIEQAVTWYRQAFKTAPSVPDALIRGALADFLSNDLASAKFKLDALRQLLPDDIGTLQLSAKVAMAMNDQASAKIFADRVLELKSGDGLSMEIINDIYEHQVSPKIN